ncbi:MAG TPA: hypothetical protein VN033_06385 [Vulgatibacter sp.]|nr:hypothetical protein [Vulgatibacter sp.]
MSQKESMFARFQAFLDRPIFPSARIAVAILTIPLVLSFTMPIWKISMVAPQYPDGLYLYIWSYKLEGGADGQHIAEINTLNHYIGMRGIDDAASADLGWIPFALGALVLIALRVAAIGNVRSLLDLTVLTSYVSLFAFGRFVYRLYVFGHDLDPTAPVKVEPFMPVVIGTKQIANFTTTSLPMAGSYGIGIFVTGTLVVTLWHLVAGRQEARRVRRSTT